jgi:hypothetical protein
VLPAEAASHRVLTVKRALALGLLLLATTVGAADEATATRHAATAGASHLSAGLGVQAHLPTLSAAGRKTQWAPTGASSPLHARAVSRGESLEGASPYGREAAENAVAKETGRTPTLTPGDMSTRTGGGSARQANCVATKLF